MNDPVYNAALVDAFLTLQIFLVFAGQQHYEYPIRNICMAQAASVYGAPIIAATATFCLVVHLLLCVISAFSRSPKYRHRSYPIVTVFLVCFPWLVWIVTVVTALVIGIKHLDHVHMNPQRTYCEITNTLIPRVVAGWVITVAGAVLCMEVVIARLLYLNRAIRDILGQSLTMVIRIFIFTVVMAFGGVLGGIFDVMHIEFDIILSILSTAAAIIFGVQTDLLKAWMFWTWNRQPTTTAGSVTLTTIAEDSHVSAEID